MSIAEITEHVMQILVDGAPTVLVPLFVTQGCYIWFRKIQLGIALRVFAVPIGIAAGFIATFFVIEMFSEYARGLIGVRQSDLFWSVPTSLAIFGFVIQIVEDETGKRFEPTMAGSIAWVEIRYEGSIKHPLYGVTGWALILGLYLTVLVITNVLDGFREFRVNPEHLSLASPVTWWAILSVGLLGTVCVAFWEKSKHFQDLFTLNAIWTVSPSAFAAFVDNRDVLGQLFVAELGLFIGLTSYVWTSKRINLTYRHRVKRTDPFLTGLDPLETERNISTTEGIPEK